MSRDADRIQMAHGGGGRMMHRLLAETVWPAFENELLATRHDGAVLPVDGARLAFTTDTYVVRPVFFPGGDIGSLAVFGTVNDLAMCGARPAWLSAAFVLEEGFPLESFRRILESMKQASAAAGVKIVTGDLKVVDRGKGDGVYLNTAGVGVVHAPGPVLPARVRPGDAILLSGDLGRHGVAILSAREGLGFEPPVMSDSAPLHVPVAGLFEAGVDVHCLRDLTRGGLASGLVEISETAKVAIELDEGSVPVSGPVRAACEILGLDPLHVANEGRFIAFVPKSDAAVALEALRRHPGASGAALIGRVVSSEDPRVSLRTSLGTSRILEMLSGEQLPRIC